MSTNLLNIPVLSLRLGSAVAVAKEPIINPHNLKIIGWWCEATDNKKEGILLVEDVREVIPGGLAVNDIDAISEPEDLVRLHEILEIRYQLVGKPVKTKRRKVGKVSDYSYNDGMVIQKLYVERSLIKVFSAEDTIIVDRNQILEVTDKFILVKDTEILAAEKEMAPIPGAVTP